MNVAGSNNINQPQYYSNYNCGTCVPYGQPQANPPAVQPQTVQNNNMPQTPAPIQNQQPVAVAQQPQLQMTAPQTVQIPANASGVNIQIFNPTVAAPGATGQTYNVNQPCYYPAGYYTGQIGQNGNNGNVNGDNTNTSTATSTDTNTNTNTTSEKKTEKKNIVQLTDEYIMNLENHLNNQDKQIRRDTAKEVYERLKEDPSRKDDKALTALINKMLQDPSEEVRMIALAALDGRYCLGDDYTVKVLQNIQKSNGGYGQDAIDATNILLKMSGKQVQKEVEVDPSREKKITTQKETKTTKAGK